MNSIPQLLLDERIACIWTTVRMPIVHFSVLLVFKKFATHNTEQFQIQCAVIQPSKLLPSPKKLAEHRSGISQVREYIFSKLSTEKEQYSFWIHTHPDYCITYHINTETSSRKLSLLSKAIVWHINAEPIVWVKITNSTNMVHITIDSLKGNTVKGQ